MKKSLLYLSLFFAVGATSSYGQIISTVAGDDTVGYTHDGVAATGSALNGPYGVNITTSGVIYVADQYNNRIRKVSTTGVITTFAGNGVGGSGGDGALATAATLTSPAGVVSDGMGNVYLSDMTNNVIRKVNSAGVISTYAGNVITGGAYGGDDSLATSSSVYLSTPMGLAVDAAGNLYIADNLNSVIRKVTASTGIITTVAGTPGLGGFGGDGGQATDAQLNSPTDVSVDAAGNLYIADFYNNRIRKVTPAGIISTIAGNGTPGFSGDGALATNAEINWPTGVAVNSNGVVFITDGSNNRIRNVYPTGVIYTLAGNGTAGFGGDGGIGHYAKLDNPYGGCLDAAGNFYFADYLYSRIRKVTPFINHVPTFTAGTTQHFNVCVNSTNDSVNSLLAISDIDTTQTENWVVLRTPNHGTLAAAYSIVSNGSPITPSGLTYAPATSYTGNDTFVVYVTDGIAFDTTTVYVHVQTPLSDPTITGLDSLCQYDSIVLTPSVAGGIWSIANTSLATLIGSDTIRGLMPGMDTIIYTISNACGPVFAR